MSRKVECDRCGGQVDEIGKEGYGSFTTPRQENHGTTVTTWDEYAGEVELHGARR